jgi:regulator of sigma E protease
MFHSLSSILLSIIGIGVIIFVHELGHFILAKLNKVRVEVFSLGYGRKLVGFKYGETTYQIGIVPLGGYCKMSGEELKEGLTGGQDEYFSKSPPARISIAAAGSVFNYLFGILLFSILLMFPRTYEAPSTVIDVLQQIEVRDSAPPDPAKPRISRLLKQEYKTRTVPAPAWEAGLRPGDRVLAVDRKPVRNWSELSPALNRNFSTEKILTVDRGGQTMDITVHPLMDRNIGYMSIGVVPLAPAVIEEVSPDSAADKAGLRKGDRVVYLNGVSVKSTGDVYRMLEPQTKPVQKTLTIIFERDGMGIKKQVPADMKDGAIVLGASFAVPRTLWTNKALLPHAAFAAGFMQANRAIGQNIQGLKLLISGKLNWRTSLSGPLKIFDFSTKIARKGGFVAFVGFMALLSVLLGFFNLLPIPPIDGSYILVFLFEWIIRKPLSKKFIEVVQSVGFVILILLTGFVFLNDIISLIQGLLP